MLVEDSREKDENQKIKDQFSVRNFQNQKSQVRFLEPCLHLQKAKKKDIHEGTKNEEQRKIVQVSDTEVMNFKVQNQDQTQDLEARLQDRKE